MFTGGPKTSPSRITTEPGGQPDADVGHPRVAADHGDDPLGGVVGAGSGRSFTNSTASPMLLITRPRWPATTSAQRDSKISTRSPIRSWSSSLDSAVKLTMSANPTVTCGGVQVLVVGAERLDPGHGGGQVAAPDVDQQLLERLVERLDQPQRRCASRLPVAVVAGLELLHPVDQRGDLPVGQPGHGLADGPGQVDRHVEVDERRRRPAATRVEQRLGVGLR